MSEKIQLSQLEDVELEKIKASIKGVINDEKITMEFRVTSGELKRTPFDRLDEMGILNPDRLIEEWKAIQERKSSLSSDLRKAVNGIFLTALTNRAYQKAEEAQREINNNNENQNDGKD